MVLAGNNAKCLSLVKYTTKTIHHYHIKYVCDFYGQKIPTSKTPYLNYGQLQVLYIIYKGKQLCISVILIQAI